MKFILIEAIFSYSSKLITIPVTFDAVFHVTNMMDNNNEIVAFKVIDTVPVQPEHFGFAPLILWNKWVMKFEEKHWRN